MYVLHAHWHFPTTPTDSGGMLFWLEDTTVTMPPKGRGRAGKKAKPHPFCVSPETAQDVLAPFHAMVRDSQFNLITLRLPTVNYGPKNVTGPQPSPQLLHDWEIDETSPPALTNWVVSGAWLLPLNAFRLLTNLPDSEELPPGLALGDDVHFWRVATNLSLEALAQQKILPVLAQTDRDGNDFHARWLPVLDGSQDAPRLKRLFEAMPPLCRAEALEQPAAPSIVLDTFLNSMTDALARSFSQEKPVTVASFARRGGHKLEPAQAWLAALFTIGPQVTASPAQLKRLANSHRLWLRNLHVAGDKAFRIAFRLEAPLQQTEAATAADWQLHFNLQARDDLSLLVPAREVWRTRGSVLKTLNRQFEQPQEKLLAGLGYAARLFPPLKDGLKTAKPVALPLSGDEAFNFMRESAPLLEASGFGVLVPPWWNKPGTRLGVRLRLSSGEKGPGADVIPKSNLSFANLVRYQWELSLGDTTLTREEFEALVALKSPLVQIRGQWVQLDPEQIEAAIQFWQKQSLAAEVDLQEAIRLGLGASGDVDGLPVEGVEVEGWLADWLQRFTGNEKLEPLPQPDSLQATLRPYQQYGYSWLNFLRRWGMGACLADDMGLGKTIQTIAMLLGEKEESGQLPGPTLLICPTSVVANWAKEVERFAPTLSAMQHQGSDRLQGEAFISEAKKHDLILTSYALLRRDAADLERVDWFGLVLDEAQNIKNPDTKQARTIRAMPGQFRLALTGTPVENRLSELWSIMHFLNPGFLGSRQGFRQQFGLPIERYGDEEATQRLRHMVSPFILRRVKTDPTVIQDLPDKLEMKVYCNLSQEQATLYESVVQDSLQAVEAADGIARRGLVLSMLMKLKQICNHPAQFLHQVGEGTGADVAKEANRSGKLSRLTEMLEEAVSVGDRVLIFSQFAEMGEMLKGHLQARLGVPALFLHGGVPANKRAVMVNRFQDEAHGPPIFILSLKAGGTGLNLTRANRVFHFDRWWNPAVEDQATDRAFRIGQTKNVQVHKFVCVGTLEEMIDDMIESKKALAQSVVGSGENWLTELSTAELRDMVTLRRETIG